MIGESILFQTVLFHDLLAAGPSTPLLAYIPFLHAWPTQFPPIMRLVMFFPLILAIATVYRATRTRHASDLPRGILITFFNIAGGMWLLAIGLYVVYEIWLRRFAG